MPSAFRGERVCCDDFEGWEIVDVRLGVDPGRSVGSRTALEGRSTKLLAYQARAGEKIVYEVRNASTPRSFRARVYGVLS